MFGLITALIVLSSQQWAYFESAYCSYWLIDYLNNHFTPLVWSFEFDFHPTKHPHSLPLQTDVCVLPAAEGSRHVGWANVFLSLISTSGTGSLNRFSHLLFSDEFFIKTLLYKRRSEGVQLNGCWWSQRDDLLQLKAPWTQPTGAFPER